MTMTGLPDRTAVHPVPDLDAAEEAARAMLGALGVPLHQPGLERTPARMVAALAEMTSPEPFEPTTFDNSDGYEGIVVVRDIAFTAVCEHHMLPFTGTACVAYLPSEHLIGLSKLSRVVTYFSRRPQVQERMTVQIAEWIDQMLSPSGVGVVLAAQHTCMTLRGARSSGSTTVTSELRGRLRSDAVTRGEFLSAAGAR